MRRHDLPQRSPAARRRCREAGSLPLALLAAIIVAGLIVVLVARIVTTQNLVRFDEAFHGSLPTADAGVNLGKFWLNDGKRLEPDGECVVPLDDQTLDGLYPPGDFPIGCSTPEETREINGSPYTFSLTRINGRQWEITSRGLATSAVDTAVERQVVGTITERPLVEVSLFAETLITFAGNNAADSYTSDSSVDTDEAWCRGSGFIATNGSVDLSGTSGGECHTHNRTVDRVMLHDWKGDNVGEGATEEEPGGDRCGHTGGGAGGANCREVSPESPSYLAPGIFEDELEYGTPGNIAFINRALKACRDHDETADDGDPDAMISGTYSTSAGSEDHAGLSPRVLAPAAPFPGSESVDFPGDVDGPFYCMESLYFDAGITEIDATSKEPVIIVVEGTVSLKGQGGGKGDPAHVGCENAAGTPTECVPGDPTGVGASRPDASRLWIFTNGDIDLGGGSAFGGVLWGPRSDCFANSQGDIFGSLICKTLPKNLGGWQFHYDEALFNVSSGEFFLSSWREESLD